MEWTMKVSLRDDLNTHRTDPVGADDPGCPSGIASRRRAGVVAPYRVGAVISNLSTKWIPSLSIFNCQLSIIP